MLNKIAALIAAEPLYTRALAALASAGVLALVGFFEDVLSPQTYVTVAGIVGLVFDARRKVSPVE